MKRKELLIGFFIMIAFCLESGITKALSLNPELVPTDEIINPQIAIPPSGMRNILLIVGDDLGIDMVKQYIPVTGNSASGLPSTPNIRRLKNSGVIFDNSWANPVCSPTRAGFLTGRHSFRTGVANAIPIGPDLSDEELTLPELISSAGYATGLFGKWHLGGGDTGPNDQGFDHHSGVLRGDLNAYDSWEKYENGVGLGTVTQYATEANAEDAIDWINTVINTQAKNWFAVVAFNAPHTDNNGDLHTPTIGCDGVVSNVPDINGMIECMDHHIGELLLELENNGELEKTTVIFIGDNGTDMASINAPFSSSPNPSYKMEVYEGGIRVPFIIADGYHLMYGTEASVSSGLGLISSPGRRANAMVHTVDIYATVAGIAGAVSTCFAQDSVSILRHLWSNFIPIPRQFMYTDRCSTSMFQAAIRDSQYKLIYRLNYNTGVLTQELYDVADLEEANNLFGTGIPSEALLLNELYNMWASEGYDPQTDGCP